MPFGSIKRLLFFAILGTFVIALPLVILNGIFDGVNIWDGWKLGNAGVYEEFCEKNRMEAFTRERMNSWSNLAFVFFGFLGIGLGIRDQRIKYSVSNILRDYPIYSWILGLSLIYLGIGSFLYHASLTYFTQRLDMAGTYAAITAIIYAGILRGYEIIQHRRNRLIKENTVWLFVILILATDLLFYLFKWQIESKIVLPAMILMTASINVYVHFSRETISKLWLSLTAFLSVAIAFTLWVLDVRKVWCDPDSIIQGHAVWHVLTGASVFLMYLYFRSVEIKGAKPAE